MVGSFHRNQKALHRNQRDVREALLVALPLAFAVLACGAVAWLTLLSGRGAVEAQEPSDAPDDDTAPRRATDARVFIAGETQ